MAMTAAALSIPFAWSVDVNALLSLALKEEYNDNVRLVSTPHDSVFITSLSPAAQLSASSETFTAVGRARLDERRYHGDSDLNSTDILLDGDVTRRFELGSLGLRASYVRDPTLASELTNTGVVQANRTRSSIGLNPSFSSQFTDRLTWKVGHDFVDVRYEDAQGTGLTDYQAGRTYTGFDYRTSERLTNFVEVGAGYFKPDNRGRDDNAYVVGGAKYQLTERVTLEGAAGPRWVRLAAPGGRTTETGWVGRVAIESSSERSSWRLAGAREVNPVGTGELTQTDRVSLTWATRMTERLSASLGGAMYWNERLGNTPLQERYYRVGGDLSWNITPRWYLDAGVSHARQMPDSGPSAKANVVFVALRYEFPLPRRLD